MKRATILLSFLALTACSRPAPEPEPVTSQAVAVAVPALVDHWIGKYEGNLMVRIGGLPKAHTVSIVVATTDGCTGDIGLAGGEKAQDVSNLDLTLTLHPDDTTTCTIDMHKKGETLTLSEGGTCTAYRGAKCSFNGQARKLP